MLRKRCTGFAASNITTPIGAKLPTSRGLKTAQIKKWPS